MGTFVDSSSYAINLLIAYVEILLPIHFYLDGSVQITDQVHLS